MRPFGTTIFTEMSALAERTGAINLGQGFPDTDGPPEIVAAAERALRSGAGPAAHALRAKASCAIGDLGNAKASFVRIPRRNLFLRRRVLSFCTRSGVDLRP